MERGSERTRGEGEEVKEENGGMGREKGRGDSLGLDLEEVALAQVCGVTNCRHGA